METVQAQPRHGDAVSMRGVVARIVFRNDDTGSSILRVTPEGETEVVTTCGPSLAEIGEQVTVTGVWKRHPKYGFQIQAQSIVTERPATPEAIERYLASGILPGVGETLAKRIVAAFGPATLDIMDNEIERLLEVHGIGEQKFDGIATAWGEQKAAQTIMLFLADQGITHAMAVRIYKRYGAAAIDLIRKNPYRLAADVRGIGFATADAIAAKLGVPHDSPKRITAGLLHLSDLAAKHGHCGMTVAGAISDATELLGLPTALISPCVEAALRAEDPALIADTLPDRVNGGMVDCLFMKRLYQSEGYSAKQLPELARRPGPWPEANDAQVRALVEKSAHAARMILEPEQEQAVINALTRRVSILTGGPGTGKTSTLKVILAALEARELKVILGAPTGKAARRMQDATGHEAFTVAKLIGMGRPDHPPIMCDVLIIDEASMVDVPMLQAILKQLDDNASLVLVGDVDQLPSIGPGLVLADLIASDALPVVRLTRIFRQAAESAIIRNAHRINRGVGLEPPVPEGTVTDFYFLRSSTPEDVLNKITQLVTDRIPGGLGLPSNQIQVISPRRGTPTGVDSINALLQQAVNPDPVAFVRYGNTRYGVGDRVLQTVNNYDLDVMNGESGVITAYNSETRMLTVKIDDREIEYPQSELDQIDLAYAMTVHKSQGSQFPAVVIPMVTQHYMMLTRAILYTAVTRATRLCIVVGQPAALEMAIRNVRAEPRLTRLRALLESVRTPGTASPFDAVFDHDEVPAIA
jgi:exodeoxyribonuclease V alpha subunit